MDALINVAPTMSSREIAELTGKRHDHVMRDIRGMLIELHGEGGLPRFGDTHRNPQNGQEYPIFRLPRITIPPRRAAMGRMLWSAPHRLHRSLERTLHPSPSGLLRTAS